MARFSKLAPARPALTGKPELNQLQSRLREEIVRLTRYEASQGPLQAKVLDETERKECSLTHLTYQAVPGRMVKALLVQPQPKNARRKAIPTWTNVARTRMEKK